MFNIVPNKALILTGVGPVGKSLIQEFIAQGHKPENVVRLNGRNNRILSDPFIFDHVNPETSLILIDDVINPKVFECFIQYIPIGEIKVDILGKKSFSVSTEHIQFVFSTEISFEKISSYMPVRRRFHIVDLNQCSHNTYQTNGKSN